MNRTKISNEQFNLIEAKISLDETIKSINSQSFQVTIPLQQNFINFFLMNQPLSFYMFITPGKSWHRGC